MLAGFLLENETRSEDRRLLEDLAGWGVGWESEDPVHMGFRQNSASC